MIKKCINLLTDNMTMTPMLMCGLLIKTGDPVIDMKALIDAYRQDCDTLIRFNCSREEFNKLTESYTKSMDDIDKQIKDDFEEYNLRIQEDFERKQALTRLKVKYNQPL